MKRFFGIYILLFTYTLFAQNGQQWVGHFSYTNVQDMTQSNGRVYAASESAMFSKSLITNELKTISSVDGLKPETITAIHYSPEYNRTLVGSDNGLLIVVNGDNTFLNKIDIVQEATVQSAKKKINHIAEYGGKAYISCDFGIAVFDLASLEFDDTYYLGPNGAEIPVIQSTVFGGYIYAATTTNGIRRGELSNPNLNDYTQWIEVYGGSWSGITSFGDNYFGVDNVGNVFRLSAGALVFTTIGSAAVDIRAANGYLVITSPNRISVYDENLIQVLQLNGLSGENVTFTCATVVSGQIFIGTKTKGVIESYLNNISIQENITPNGPLRSSIFSLERTSNSLWAVFGGYDYQFIPDYSQRGISELTAEGWNNIPYEDVLNAKSLTDVAVNPTNNNEVYVASYHNGLLRLEEDVPIQLYDDNNSPLENQQFIPGFDNLRVNSLYFDDTGALWMTNDMTEKPLKVFRNGNWTSYSFVDVISAPKDNKYQKMIIDRNGTKWIPSINSGLIGFNESLGNKFIVISNDDFGNLPTEYAKCVAIDNSNRLWIGTSAGLRVLSGIDRFLTEDVLSTNAIIIEEDGLAQELLYEQDINDIEVDGSNNKWVATGSAGAFLISPDGQRTLFHFTKLNSPLPSNTINDIAIDSQTGDVYFATDKGMVAYKGTATDASGDLSNVYVYPNPVRPGFEGEVKISGLIDNANIKITDIEGNLVYETTSEGGTVLWDTRAFGRYKVASGVYMIFIASEDATETKVKKVMIIR
ncbi:T9SS C-terminal target domain-containing protein [Flavobacterium arcticum]|uniref:T9SS C-terminal target domain-containing protein n=1 Tax=Flavobacterium arcticum TaxID=1784713 RepID=A0A345HBG7_9FLAO|nr:T9SS type A sorting domain-containing protein [Flavobacterium arcticum]AXG73927.1 T9SS C-terminal target domain-containing protein [Flavobacterium arcticum]KAF2508903.1 T9SS type A sorting domain-containing protein [Flavobacterium arcticum]